MIFRSPNCDPTRIAAITPAAGPDCSISTARARAADDGTTPPDDCSYQVNLTTITATLSGDTITATASGHLTSTCTSSSNVNEDFGVMSGTAKRQ